MCGYDLGGNFMADNKQYVAQLQENGSVQISEDVIAAIVSHAACEVDGVVGVNTKPGADIADLIGKKSWGRGLKITVSETNSVSIECDLIVNYGQHVVDVAKAAQIAIINALESMSAIEIDAVNVNVCGIVRQ